MVLISAPPLPLVSRSAAPEFCRRNTELFLKYIAEIVLLLLSDFRGDHIRLIVRHVQKLHCLI